MRTRLVHLYIAVMCVAAAAALALTDWGSLPQWGTKSLFGLAALIGMGLLSESLAVRLDVGKTRGDSNASITFIPLLASVQLFGPAAAVLLMATTGAFGEFVIRRKSWDRTIFNVSQWTVATFVGGWIFTLSGGIPVELPGHEFLFRSQLAPFVLFGLVFLALNHSAVSLVIALSQGLRFGEVLHQMAGNSGASLNDLLISPIAIAVAFLYVQLGWASIFLVLFPVVFIRRAYSMTNQLRDANDNLLRALVKAIETRDPYTSGHSVRVSYLARRIAEEMGLPRANIARIETAALLHDIGKIESLYTGILGKPDSLTPEERSIIQSHVTKGEDLLRSMSSYPEDVILTVRHHHEREDGGGYPDGLRGDEIPVGARIVSVCDAIDAMLSDRPYRRALSVPAVLRELQEHVGRQFSPSVVDALLNSDLISEYAALMPQFSKVQDGAGNFPVTPSSLQATVPPPLAMGPRRKRNRLRMLGS